MRFATATVSELRAQYLFALANLCGVRPTDNMRVVDFFQLILGVDSYIEEQKRSG